MKNKPILYHIDAKTQSDNLGDLVINAVLANEISKSHKVRVNTFGCTDSYSSMFSGKKTTKIKETKLQTLITLIKKAKSEKVVYILNPGHHFIKQKIPLKHILKLMFYSALRASGVELIRLGASLGPNSKAGDWCEIALSKLCTLYTARESLSYEHSKKLGITNITSCPDMAFLIATPCEGSRHRDQHVLSFREGILLNDTTNKNSISHIVPSKLPKKISTLPVFLSQVTRDDNFNSSLCESTPAAKNLGAYPYISHEEIFDSYSHTDFVLSNRLHVLLFSASQGAIPIPVIRASLHTKITGVFESAGLGKLIFDLDRSDSLAEHIEHILEQREEIRDKVTRAFNTESLKIKKILDQLSLDLQSC